MIKRLILIFTAASFMLAAAGEALSKDKSNVSYVNFNGKINPDSVARLLSEITAPDETYVLTLNSVGGNELAAIQLAQELKSRKVIIIVNEFCLSACANILLMSSSDNIYINENAIIGFHTGIFGWLEKLYQFDRVAYQENLYRGKRYAEFLGYDRAIANSFRCIDNLHVLSDSFTQSEKKFYMQTEYKFLSASLHHLKTLNPRLSFFQGETLDDRIRTDLLRKSRLDWEFSDCKLFSPSIFWDKVWQDLTDG